MDIQKETERAEVLLPAQLDDDVLRYVMECAHLNNPDGARLVKSIHLFMHEALRTRPPEPQYHATLRGMADCMDMVWRELIEAGVIDQKVAPMFVAEAVLARLDGLRNEMLVVQRRLAGETLRAGLAEARAASKSKECIELRERMAARPAIPATPEQAIAFIGNQCEVREDAVPLDRTRFQLTVHDLLSAFRWWFHDDVADGAIYEAVSRRADPAAHDAAVAESMAVLSNSAEFDGIRMPTGRDQTAVPVATGAVETRMDTGFQPLPEGGPNSPEFEGINKAVTVTEKGPWQAEEIAQRLPPPRATVAAVTAELLAAGNAVVEHWHSRDWKKPPTADVIARLTRAVGRVKRGRELYTCVDKGGEYELVGEAKGAGTLKTYSGLIVYQDSMTGQMYCRSMTDFDKRMQRIKETL